MARANLIQTNFTAGELSPRMLGRVDVARYNNGAKRIENCVVYIHGGAARRPGTRFIVPAKYAAKRAILHSYVFSTRQAYHIEIGHLYVRFYTAAGDQILSGGLPYEVAAPYTEQQLVELHVCQRADTMFLWHPNVPTQRLQRFGNADWRLMPVPWVTEPFDELGHVPGITLTLSSATVGPGRTATVGGAFFVLADLGRTIEVAGGIATITAIVNSSTATVDISYPFNATSYPIFGWTLTGSPQSTVTPSTAGPVGSYVEIASDLDAFHTWDVGAHIVINGGLVRVTGYTDAQTLTGEVRVAMGAAVAAQPNAWALCRTMWGFENGYPRTGTFYQQRLYCGGSPGFPQSVWMSRLAEPLDMEISTEADGGFELSVDSDQANPLQHLASGRAIVALSTGAESSVQKSGDGGMKPGNIDVINQSALGCNQVPPVWVGNELMFVSPSGRKIRALSADRFDASNYAAPDITALAEHVTETGIVDMDGQSEPDAMLWTVRTDGQLPTCTLDRDNDVVAWTRQITDGGFESVSVAPSNGAQVVLTVVRRVINGSEVRYIEVFDPAVLMDCAVVVTDPSAFDILGELDHLEGKTVVVRGDGFVQGEKVVTGGEITLDTEVTSAQVGLPFTPLVELMTPEVQGPNGSAQGKMMRTPEVTILVKDTVGAQINGRDVIFGMFGESVLDVPPTPYSGPERLELLGYERGSSDIVITQTRPEPFHLLAVIRQMEVNG